MKIKKITNKILFTLLITVLYFLKTNITVKAADYLWPVSTKNASETYIEYWYQDRTYNSSEYDTKYNYAPYELNYNKTEHHYGVDITGIKGKIYEIVSVSNGKVIATSNDRFFYSGINFKDRNQRKSSKDGGGYGNYIIIVEQTTGKCFLYAHLKEGTITLKRGDNVEAGQTIGVMGSSGDSGHMHLHFEVRKNITTTTISNGASLVPTTAYNVETEDPVKYIGDKFIEQKTEPKEDPKEVLKKEQDEILEDKLEQPIEPAKIKSITHQTYNKYIKINIEFNKGIKINKVPTLTAKVNKETINATYIGITNDKTLSYKIELDKFDVFTSGNMYINTTNGNIVNKEDLKTTVNSTINNYRLYTLKPHNINNTYEHLIYNQTGDVNRDGYINSIDASLVLSMYTKKATGKSLSKEEQEYYKRADVNNDGIVNSIDSSEILSYYASKQTGLDIEKQKKIIKCDFDKNKIIDINDYNLLLNVIKNNKYEEKYDLNNDKKLNNIDIEYLKKIVKQFGKRR